MSNKDCPKPQEVEVSQHIADPLPESTQLVRGILKKNPKHNETRRVRFASKTPSSIPLVALPPIDEEPRQGAAPTIETSASTQDGSNTYKTPQDDLKTKHLTPVLQKRLAKANEYLNHPERYFLGEKLDEVREAIRAYVEARKTGDSRVKLPALNECLRVCGLPLLHNTTPSPSTPSPSPQFMEGLCNVD